MLRIASSVKGCGRKVCLCKKTLQNVSNRKTVFNYWSDYVKCFISEKKSTSRSTSYDAGKTETTRSRD